MEAPAAFSATVSLGRGRPTGWPLAPWCPLTTGKIRACLKAALFCQQKDIFVAPWEQDRVGPALALALAPFGNPSLVLAGPLSYGRTRHRLPRPTGGVSFLGPSLPDYSHCRPLACSGPYSQTRWPPSASPWPSALRLPPNHAMAGTASRRLPS